MVISPEDKKLLHEAIEAAKGFGECNYVLNGEPQCVVAQAAIRCGITTEFMTKEWVTSSGTSPAYTYITAYLPNEKLAKLNELNSEDLLDKLQEIWDLRNIAFLNEASARQGMHNLVDQH